MEMAALVRHRIATLIPMLVSLSLAACTKPPIKVTISNETSERIHSAELVHESGTIVANDIAPGESRDLQFKARGETSYHLVLVFDSGRRVEGGGNYAEPGYSFREHVRADGITNELAGM
jgi:hypothetical protein